MSRGFLDEDAGAAPELDADDVREVEIACTIVRTTRAAFIIDSGDRKTHVVPRTLVRNQERLTAGDHGRLRMSLWFARKEGII